MTNPTINRFIIIINNFPCLWTRGAQQKPPEAPFATLSYYPPINQHLNTAKINLLYKGHRFFKTFFTTGVIVGQTQQGVAQNTLLWICYVPGCE